MNSLDFSNYKYPQYLWSKELIIAICELDLDISYFVDAPCGNGTISYWLQKKFITSWFHLRDIDKVSINYARQLEKNKNVQVSLGDIYDLPSISDNDTTMFLLINSLFLLPDTEKLLSLIKSSSNYSAIILPHIEHENFKAFFKKRPNYPLHYHDNMEKVDKLFSDNGFYRIYSKEICNISHHKLPKFPIIYNILLKLCNIIEPKLPKNNPAYYLLVYRHDETDQ